MTAEDDMLLDRLLAGDLSPAEAQTLQARLGAEPELAARLQLRRELLNTLSGPEAELRSLIADADADHFDPPPRRPNRWWFLFLLLPILALGWWAITAQESPEDNSAPPVSIPSEDSTDAPAQRNITPPTEDSTTTPPAPQPAEPGPQPTERPVFAALNPEDFARSPTLEGVIGGAVRSGPATTTIELPLVRDTLVRTGDAILRITSAATPPYELFVYDNDEDKFLREQPVLQATLSAVSATAGYRTAYNLAGLTRSGRYYLLVLDSEGDILAGRTVLVR